jgi:hypothetical protein
MEKKHGVSPLLLLELPVAGVSRPQRSEDHDNHDAHQ